MRDADKIRMYGKEKYVLGALNRKEKSFSIRAGDVVRELEMSGRAPAVCSALKSRQFLHDNNLRLVAKSGPKSGQSTTVVYTYEFVNTCSPPSQKEDAWTRLRGALKDVFAELGGGEAYLRNERDNFFPPKESE